MPRTAAVGLGAGRIWDRNRWERKMCVQGVGVAGTVLQSDNYADNANRLQIPCQGTSGLTQLLPGFLLFMSTTTFVHCPHLASAE
jgi:hypothetical protein